jgi:hypothetical protein
MSSYFVSLLENEIPLLGFVVYSIKYILRRYVINNFVEIDIYKHSPNYEGGGFMLTLYIISIYTIFCVNNGGFFDKNLRFMT